MKNPASRNFGGTPHAKPSFHFTLIAAVLTAVAGPAGFCAGTGDPVDTPGGAGWRRLYESDDIGPPGYWMIARNADAGRKEFAIKDLTRLSHDDLHKDCRALLEGDAILNECLRNSLEAARELNDADVESLCGWMDEAAAGVLPSGVKALRKTSDPVTLASLTPALDEWWDVGLRARVSAALRQLAIRPDHPPQSP